MDVLSHGLWPFALTVKRKGWRWWAFGWGMFPDVGTIPQIFYLASVGNVTAFVKSVDWETLFIPEPWMAAYHATHNVFAPLVLAGVWWLWKRRAAWPLLIGWYSHLALDLFTHVGVYANRPFYPLSNFSVSGILWGDPRIFIPNVVGLAVVFGWLGIRWFRRRRAAHAPVPPPA